MKTLLVFVLFSASLAASAAECPPRSRWPTQAWEEERSTRAEAIAALESYAFTRTGEDSDRVGIRTDSVLVVHEGKVVYERYAPAWDENGKHLTWSISKSVTSALVGIATEKAGLDVKKSLCTWIDSPREEHCEVSVEELLWMSSGIQWQEVYEGKSNQASSVLSMLYGYGNADAPHFVLDHARVRSPGTYHSYSSGTTNVIMAIAEKAMREAGAGEDWPWRELFDRIGMKRVSLETDRAGNRLGSSYVYTTPRDLAKFGFLYLNEGCWAGERVLPEGWVQASQTPTPATEFEDPKDVYGYQWWLNLPNAQAEGGRPWPSLPVDAYAARGHWGQSLTIVPSLNLVFVRFADDRDDTFDYDRFAGLVLALVE